MTRGGRRVKHERSLFEILAERRHSELVEGIIWPSSKEDESRIERAYEKEFEWERLCGNGHQVLGQELVREIHWALEGMGFAIDRVAALHFRAFHKVVGRIDPQFFISTQINWPMLSRSELAAYRAALMLFNVTEVYFWMGAVWDRMGQFLNLFAFNNKNIAKSKDGWRQIFDRFNDNFGNIAEIRGNEEYQTLVRLHRRVYEKAYSRRNILAHKGSFAGRIRATIESDSEKKELLWQFVLGKESWDLTNILDEINELAGSCQEAATALQRFVGDFLRCTH
jgi:hypothetical protein